MSMPEKKVDIRESVLRKCDDEAGGSGIVFDGDGCAIFYDGKIQPIYNAMDENGKRMCLDLLEYMAKNRIACGVYSSPDGELFKYRGRYITAEQLFENFL